MKKKAVSANNFEKALAGILVAAMIFTSLLAGLGGTKADPDQAAAYAAILYFERANPVFEKQVNAGTALESLGLPEELRAVIEIEEEEAAADETPDYEPDYETEAEALAEFEPGETAEDWETAAGEISAEPAGKEGFRQTEPRVDEDGEYDYLRYGYAAPEDEEWLRENGLTVIYVLDSEGGEADYRVHGTYNGAGEGYYACDEHGNITGFAATVPVTWEGEYDGDTPGVYVLRARLESHAYGGEAPAAVITVIPAEGSGSISGSLSLGVNAGAPAEGGEEPETAVEQPLEGVVVNLYSADDLSEALDWAVTDADGSYIFENLSSESYVLGLEAKTVFGQEFELPLEITEENKFAADESGEAPHMAFTEIIGLDEGQELENVNAVFSDGISPRANYTLADLAIVGRNDLITNVDGFSWRVIKTQQLYGVNYYLLVMSTTHHHNMTNQSQFGTSTDYNGSYLQARMTDHYNSYPTIRAIAAVPDLGVLTNEKEITRPTSVMAADTGQTVDIMFALSIQDYIDWNNGVKSPLYTPLSNSSNGQRAWSRTPRTTAQLFALINVPGGSYNGLDGGVNYNSYNNIGELPAVWVNGGAVQRQVKVYYVDTDGNAIGSVFEPYPVTAGNTFTMYSSYIPEIEGYTYKEWKIGVNGTPDSGGFPSPTLTKQQVLSGTDIYLVFEGTGPAKATVTVHYIDKDTGSPIGNPTSSKYFVNVGDTFVLPNQDIPNIPGYVYNEWKVGASGAVSTSLPVTVANVVSDTDVYLLYDKAETGGGGDIKNAYVPGISTPVNGAAGAPAPVKPEDQIKYTITANNYMDFGSSDAEYDVLFVLDWSSSMESSIYGGLSAKLYEREVMLDMFDFITKKYPNSRVAVMGMNSTGMTNNNDNTHIQYESDFLTPAQYKNGMRDEIAAAFELPSKNKTEDLSVFLKAALHKLRGVDPSVTTLYGNASSTEGNAKNTIPRKPLPGKNLEDRIPVIVLISDFQIPSGQSVGSENYWTSVMRSRVNVFSLTYPNGILHTVRFDHQGNHSGGNAVYSTSTYDSLMRANVSPATAQFPPNGKAGWSFTGIDLNTSYDGALNKIKDSFIASSPVGEPVGTFIFDKVPEGMELNAGSISHNGIYDPITRVITWDLTGENEGEITVEFTATVKQASQTFENTAYIAFPNGSVTESNTTYHKAESLGVTISKTLKNEPNTEKEFSFMMLLFSTPDNPLTPGQVFNYVGGVVSSGADAPPDGTLTLDDNGTLFFTLKHGQAITIKGIPSHYSFMVFEIADGGIYDTVNTVNGVTETTGTQTGIIQVGDGGITVDYVNKRKYVPPTGVAGGNGVAEGVMLAAALALLTGLAAMEIRRKRKA